MQYVDYSDRKRKHGTRRKREGREKATRKIRNSKRTEKEGWRNGQQGAPQKEKVNLVKLDPKWTSVSNTTEILWCFYTFDRHLLNVLIHIYICVCVNIWTLYTDLIISIWTMEGVELHVLKWYRCTGTWIQDFSQVSTDVDYLLYCLACCPIVMSTSIFINCYFFFFLIIHKEHIRGISLNFFNFVFIIFTSHTMKMTILQ